MGADRLPPPPRYGNGSVAEVGDAVLAALGVAGAVDRLGLPPAPRACLLLVDGLGSAHLRAHADVAPFIAGVVGGRSIDAVCPTTTAASLASLATGLTPGEHGFLGATVAIAGYARPMSLLRWKLYGVGPRVELVEDVPPEVFQPARTLLERAAAAGLDPVSVGPAEHAGTGLSRALFRGGSRHPAAGHDEVVAAAVAALEGGSRLVYAYHGDLDLAGHVAGPASPRWREELARIDRMVAGLAEQRPAGTLLVVTSDHGIVTIADDDLLDVADAPELVAGVRLLAGEPRFRHVHTEAGAAADVLAAWREVVGDRMWVVSGEEAAAAGWFGPTVSATARPRIGDVVAAARDPVGVAQKVVDPRQREMTGHHGSLTRAEVEVPLAVVVP